MRYFSHAIHLRTALWLLVAACTIPAVVVAVLALWHQYDRAYDRLLEQESSAARAVSAIIDREVAMVIGSLHTLRHSSAIGAATLPAFQRQAVKVLATLPSARDVYMTDPHGRLLMSTRAPAPGKLPMSGNVALVKAIMSSGQPRISGIFTGTLTGRRMVSVGVPVSDAAGKVHYALFASLDVDKLATLLRDGKLMPASWIVSVHDRDGLFIARSREHARFNGQKGSADLMAALSRAPEGVLEGVTREGIHVIAAYTLSPVSGWTVAIGAPKAALVAQLRLQILLAIAGVLVVLVFGVLAARVLSSRIRQAVAELVPQADRLSAWETFAPTTGPIIELNTLSQSLAQASQVLRLTRHQAQHDPLTGLANRNLLIEILDFQINFARRTESSVALLYIDLDGFKAINDSLGHLAGDELLAASATRMKDMVRASDCAARLGGDEFVIALSDTDAHGAETLAKRLIAELSAPVVTSCGEVAVFASIGIALYPYSASNSADLILSADEAMYRSKATGKNRFTLQVDARGAA
ncbi:sensor domain-containing diguanylate cyclase [Massilia sp. PAMC28688]|uniref:bifunctional diguanylate cyclase/phosphodiesterase n=1 Tax=Massilia sp. PAMC28688 TaxID=2861283 RepID=UPI001C62D87E|nr:sensor domain-containing diguanylate cyclase [Massilia sp. PAMC28688]QYF92922.1 sensor domain-containing diguanylate cyclase [Massilia sp. PAMC28688]